MKKRTFLIPLVSILLVGCNQTVEPTTSGNPATTGTVPTTSQSDWTGKTNDDFPLAATTFSQAGVEKPLNMNTIYSNQGAPHLDPLTEQHVMVVPFGFNDPTTEKVQTKANIERMQTTFFGTEEEIRSAGGWESMASFYKKSSYGKSDFEGQVVPAWCTYDGTVKQFETASGGNLGVYAAEYARTWYMAEYNKENHGELGEDAKPFSWFDCNGDGFLDLVWIVYSTKTVDTNSWWAYVTYTSNGANKAKPTVKTLGFASIDWLDKSYNGYDPHTFIHETGHTYGLADYYDYTNSWARMGGVDFMDHNLGDHCMYSKFSLGWTAPWVVDDNALITLRPGTTTGDCFILPSPGYNGTAFDEYIMVELMAPVGLAEADYKNGYENTMGFSEPGIRITHVDSRVYKNNRDVALTTNPQEGVDIRVDNTKGGRGGLKIAGDYFPINDGQDKGYYYQISILESTINKDMNVTNSSTYNASNSSLFKQGHRFDLKPGKDSWADVFMPSKTNLWNKAKTITGWKDQNTQTYTINEEMTFNYRLKVVSIKEDSEFGYVAQVQVTKDAY